MISFRNGRKPRDYMSRREQRRLLFFVLSLGLIMILICEARKPGNWQWIQNDGQNKGQWKANDIDETAVDEQLLNTTIFEGLDKGLLQNVRDNTRFRDEENAAWFNLLNVLKHADERQIRRKSIGRVSLLQLNEQSQEYRGELVAVQGTVRRANRTEAAPNDKGIDSYYQVWLFSGDNPSWPIVVYCLEMPKGFPIGMELQESASVTGFYFKKWLYLGQKDLETAPVILAKTIEWKKTIKRDDETSSDVVIAIYIVIGGSAVFALLALAYILCYTRDRLRKRNLSPEDINFNLDNGDKSENEQNDEH